MTRPDASEMAVGAISFFCGYAKIYYTMDELLKEWRSEYESLGAMSWTVAYALFRNHPHYEQHKERMTEFFRP